LLKALAGAEIPNSLEFAAVHNFNHERLVGTILSLSAERYLLETPHSVNYWALTDEALTYYEEGSPEYNVLKFVQRSEGVDLPAIKAEFGPQGDIGFSQAMKNKWIALDKATKKITANVEKVPDTLWVHISHVFNVKDVPVEQCPEIEPDIKVLKARKLVDKKKVTFFSLVQGPNFADSRRACVSDLSASMLASKEWQSSAWKEYNFNALGLQPKGGHLHPLLKIRSQFKKILFEMGFEEMPTNSFVESSFWNFDSLFQPQQHPARDAHDTFFIKDPPTIENYPRDYMERVKSTHERGGYGSLGWRYDWSEDEAKKPILRTHTTAVSSRMLYKLAQEGFRPAKYFSIDRVFRNETLDATHLAEFHQVEGLVAGPDLGLADLIGVIAEFFKKIGITNLRFKPAYNPYTEPSMEIFGFHPQLNKWTEIGNSGVFRPEMLKPMGLPDGVGVIAWGLSLERPTMIQYGIDNIRELFGHKLELSKIEANPISILGS